MASIFDTALQNMELGGNTQADIAGGGAALQSMNSYINPYQQQVVNSTVGQMQNSFDQNYNRIGDAAISGGAFGGSRQGVAEGTAIGDFTRNVGDVAGNLNHQGFNLASQLGLQNTGQQMNAASNLVNTGATQYATGRSIVNDQMASGNQQQQLSQSLLDMANQDVNSYQNSPTSSLATILSALSGSPLQGNQTTSMKPGLFDYLGLGAQAIGGGMMKGAK